MGGASSKPEVPQTEVLQDSFHRHHIVNAYEEAVMLSVAHYNRENRRGTWATLINRKEQNTIGVGILGKSAVEKSETGDVNEVSRYDSNYVLVHPEMVLRFGSGQGDYISIKMQYSSTMIAEDFKLAPGQSIIITPDGKFTESKYKEYSLSIDDLWIERFSGINYKGQCKDPKPLSEHYVCNAYSDTIVVAYQSFYPESMHKSSLLTPGDQNVVACKPEASGGVGSYVTIPPGTMAPIGTGKGDALSIRSASLSDIIMANVTLQPGTSVIITPEGGMTRSKYIPGGNKSDLWLDEFTGVDYRSQFEMMAKMMHYIGNASKVPVTLSIMPCDEPDTVSQGGASRCVGLPSNRPIDSVSQYSGGDTSNTTTGSVAGNMVTVGPGEHIAFGTGKGDRLNVQYKKDRICIAYNFKIGPGDSVIVTPQGGLAQSKLRAGGEFKDLWINRDDGTNYKEDRM